MLFFYMSLQGLLLLYTNAIGVRARYHFSHACKVFQCHMGNNPFPIVFFTPTDLIDIT